MTEQTKDSEHAQFQYEKSLLHLVAAVHAVRKYRQMNAAEPPESQDAWDRLIIAVLEAEHILRDTDLARERPLPGASRSAKA